MRADQLQMHEEISSQPMHGHAPGRDNRVCVHTGTNCKAGAASVPEKKLNGHKTVELNCSWPRFRGRSSVRIGAFTSTSGARRPVWLASVYQTNRQARARTVRGVRFRKRIKHRRIPQLLPENRGRILHASHAHRVRCSAEPHKRRRGRGRAACIYRRCTATPVLPTRDSGGSIGAVGSADAGCGAGGLRRVHE